MLVFIQEHWNASRQEYHKNFFRAVLLHCEAVSFQEDWKNQYRVTYLSDRKELSWGELNIWHVCALATDDEASWPNCNFSASDKLESINMWLSTYFLPILVLRTFVKITWGCLPYIHNSKSQIPHWDLEKEVSC